MDCWLDGCELVVDDEFSGQPASCHIYLMIPHEVSRSGSYSPALLGVCEARTVRLGQRPVPCGQAN
jgi:hypothetical protein